MFSISATRLGFSLLNNIKNLDPSYQTDLDFWEFQKGIKKTLSNNL